MQLIRQSTGETFTLDPAFVIGRGGEGTIYRYPPDAKLAAKVYHPSLATRTEKLKAMIANPPNNPMRAQGHASIAWPVDLVCEASGRRACVGYLMPNLSGMHPLIQYYTPKQRVQIEPGFHYEYLLRTATNLANAISALHASNYVIGDVNESNFLVSDRALVTVIDTDSFQVRNPQTGLVHRCHVGKAEYTPPELIGKDFSTIDRYPEHDLFGMAVLIYQLLMEGEHPFNGVYQGPGDSPTTMDAIRSGYFLHTRTRQVPYQPKPYGLPFSMLPSELQQLFLKCFDDGHTNQSTRPSAAAWHKALQSAESALLPCGTNLNHRYPRHLNECPWCKRASSLGVDWFPQPTQQPPSVQRPLPSPQSSQVPTKLPSSVTSASTPVTPQPLPRHAPHQEPGLLHRQLLFGDFVVAFIVGGICAMGVMLVVSSILGVQIQNRNDVHPYVWQGPAFISALVFTVRGLKTLADIKYLLLCVVGLCLAGWVFVSARGFLPSAVPTLVGHESPQLPVAPPQVTQRPSRTPPAMTPLANTSARPSLANPSGNATAARSPVVDITEYYNLINTKRLEDAYILRCENSRRRTSFRTFKETWSNNNFIKLEDAVVQEQSSSRAQLKVKLTSSDRDRRTGESTITTYDGNITAVLENSRWRYVTFDFSQTRRDSVESMRRIASETLRKTKPCTATGLKYKVLAEGSGTIAVAGKMVTVHYTGTLEDGKKFDSSRDPGRTPIEFKLGAGMVIKGWDEGIAGMKVGEKRKLTIPPALAYGAQGRLPVIPSNATLLFDVELIGAK